MIIILRIILKVVKKGINVLIIIYYKIIKTIPMNTRNYKNLKQTNQSQKRYKIKKSFLYIIVKMLSLSKFKKALYSNVRIYFKKNCIKKNKWFNCIKQKNKFSIYFYYLY